MRDVKRRRFFVSKSENRRIAKRKAIRRARRREGRNNHRSKTKSVEDMAPRAPG